MVKVPLWRWGSSFVAVLVFMAGLAGAVASPPQKVWQKVYDGSIDGSFLRSKDGKTVVSGADDGAIWVWKVGQPGRQVRIKAPINVPVTYEPIAISSNANYVLMAGGNVFPEVVNLATGKTVFTVSQSTEKNFLDSVPGLSEQFLYYRSGGYVRVFDFLDGKLVYEFKLLGRYIRNNNSCVKPDGTLIFNDGDGRLLVVDPESWKSIAAIDIKLALSSDYGNYAYSCLLGKNKIYIKFIIWASSETGLIEEITREMVYDYIKRIYVYRPVKNTDTRANASHFTYIFEGYGLKTYPYMDKKCDALADSLLKQNQLNSEMKTFRVTKISTGEKVLSFCGQEEKNYLDRSMLPNQLWFNSARLESITSDGNIYDAETRESIKVYGDTPKKLLRSPCGRFTVNLTSHGVLELFPSNETTDVTQSPQIGKLGVLDAIVESWVWDASGTFMAVGSRSGIYVWELPNVVKQLDCQDLKMGASDLTPLGDALRLTQPKFITLGMADDWYFYIRSLTFSPNSERLAIGDVRGNVQIWSTKTWQRLDMFKTDRGGVLKLDWSSDGSMLASASGVGQVWLHDFKTGKTVGSGILAPVVKPNVGEVSTNSPSQPVWIREAAWNLAGTQLAIAGSWGELYLWTPGQKPTKLLTTSEKEGFTTVSWLTAGKLLVGQLDGQVKIVSASDGQVLHSWAAGADAVLSLIVSGSDITTLTRDKVLTRWRLGK